VLPLPTVFDHAGQIDKPVMRQMIDYYVASGINAIFVGGSMGQGMAMTQEERKSLFELSVEAVNGRVPVLAHVGTADPYTTIDLGKHALKVGANALAIVGPYYYSDRSHAELRAHFKMVGEALQAPILLYNNPKYQGYPITPELMRQIVEDSPQVFGTKLAMGGVDEALIYGEILGPKFKMFAICSQLFPGMRMGIAGTVSPPLAVFPELGVELIRAIDRKDNARALELQVAATEFQAPFLSNVIKKECGRAIYRAGLQELGFKVKAYPRWPTGEVTPQRREWLSNLYKRMRMVLAKKAA
jgi:dihydrodipicolinate synthase/N-acetylneuraminate lyase